LPFSFGKLMAGFLGPQPEDNQGVCLQIMKSTAMAGMWVGIVAASVIGSADVKGHPYQTIITRNAFALRAIPVETPRPEPEVLPAPPLEIKLTGVTTLLGVPCAFLEFIDPQIKKTDRPPLFREGDRYNEQITIVRIDARNGWVKIRNNGVEATLDFERNGIKPSPPPATVSAPAGVSRTFALATAPPANTSERVIVGPAALPGPSLRQATMTREEALASLERQRAIYQQQNHPALNILPPPGPGRAPAAIADPRLR
jgi:hypothetical protein